MRPDAMSSASWPIPRWARGVGLTVLAGLAAYAAYKVLLPLEWREAVWVFRHHTLPGYLHEPRKFYASPWTYVIVSAVFLLERVMPARPAQRTWSASLLQDFVWFNADAVFRVTWLGLYLQLLNAFYQRHLAFLTVDAVAAWSPAARWVCSFLVFDFLNWGHHVIRHRVEALWYFHMVHHSQRELNLFTDARVHLLEPFVARTLIFLPMLMLQVNLTGIFWLAILLDWYTRVYHANLRTNYGPFKYLLVTPQSHRIHHSRDPAHYNKNFGLFLTVWDRLFGTLHARYDDYPETGMEEEFPLENMVPGLGVFATYGRQLWFPFQRLLRAPNSMPREPRCERQPARC